MFSYFKTIISLSYLSIEFAKLQKNLISPLFLPLLSLYLFTYLYIPLFYPLYLFIYPLSFYLFPFQKTYSSIYLLYNSGRRSLVRSKAEFICQAEIFFGSPLNNSSGTFQPRKSAGREYTAGATNPS
jgi:hypothetical protein